MEKWVSFCLLPLVIKEESPLTHGNPLIKKNKYETLCEESPWEQILDWVKSDSLVSLVSMGEPTYGRRALV